MPQTAESIQADFDRLALLAGREFDHNVFYHRFLRQHLPVRCAVALEIGCGAGSFARLLAARAGQVVAYDLSPQMLRLAAEHSAAWPNIEYRLADVRAAVFEPEQFDCIVSIATLHHLPLRETLAQLKSALKPGGTLAVLDLYQAETYSDFVVSATAVPLNGLARLLKTGRLFPPRELREAWDAHGRTDHYLTLREVRHICAEVLPSTRIHRHLFWRYSIIWKKE